MSSRGLLQNFLVSGDNDQEARSKPIADLFPNTSVMFADIVGFTVSSFALLELGISIVIAPFIVD